MGEEAILEIAQRLARRRIRQGPAQHAGHGLRARSRARSRRRTALVLPSYDDVCGDKPTFAEATRIIHNETNPYNAKRLVQWHDRQAVVANPPAFPISQASMDVIYTLPYTRQPHPSYTEPIPAFEMIKDSVTIMRGLLRRLHVLLDHGPSRPHDSVAQQGIGAAAKSSRWPPIPSSKARSATSAGRPPTCIR